LSKLLLVLPLHAYRRRSKTYVDAQARNGLRLWLDNFDTLTSFLPIDDERITFTALPSAGAPHRFITALPKTIPILKNVIASADHLHFAIGGMFGDWGSISALIAHQRGKPFAVWTDKVESQVLAFEARSKSPPKKLYHLTMATLMKPYERYVIRKSALGLFHGMDCYEAYSPYSSNPQLVHDIHLNSGDQISDLDIDARLQRSGPVLIAYAGRAHLDKGIYDWIDALSLAAKEKIDFRAVWFGGGDELENARKHVKDENLSDYIEFHGPTTSHQELIEKLRSFDLFMFCHKTQESPRCLIEALICGLPLVGYDSPYSRDLIKANGGGILTSIHRPELLAGSIRQFSQRRRHLTKNAQSDGKLFDAATVFRHRSDLMKTIGPRLGC
jgi:colanic acid/amylovoran biosynthesis glycosyltransferase